MITDNQTYNLSVKQFKLFFHDLSDSVFVLNGTKIVYTNKTARKLWGTYLNISDFLDEHIVHQIITCERKTHLKVQLTVNNQQKQVGIEVIYLNQSGFAHLVFLREDTSYNVGKVVDITLAHTKRQLMLEKKKNIVDYGFFEDITHQLRTAANSVLGFSKLLRTEQYDKQKRRRYNNLIIHNASVIETTINSMIDYVKSKNNSFKLEKNVIDVTKLLVDVQTKFQQDILPNYPNRAQLNINPKNIEEELIVETDEYRLKQLIVSLINSVFTFMQQPLITLSVTVANQKIVLTLHNKATTIDENKLFAIKKELKQTQQKSTTETQIAIVKQNINLFQGEIFFNFVAENTTEYILKIPYKQSPKKYQTTMQRDITKLDWTGKTILVVDDFEPVFLYIEEILRKTNVTYMYVQSGRESISMCMNNPQIDLVLMDIQLPDISGIEAVKEIKKINPNIYVIAQTAYALPEDKASMLEEGLDDYVAKPLDKEELLTKIDEFFNPE